MGMNAMSYDSNQDDRMDDDAGAIAIIGMSGRFAEAHDLATFWQNLRNGVESVRPVSDETLLANGVDPAEMADKNYIKVASTLDGVDRFDAEFFGISPREAEVMDPQQRLFLECAWEALEHAGYDPKAYAGAIGLYAGTALSSYLVQNLMPNRQLLASVGDRQVLMVNEKDFLCGRVAFELNLRGPAVVVQTACSTSLVAVHMACQSVLNGECDMALAGGVSIQALEKRGYLYTEGGLLSADGHCRAFDASATGIVTGNGLGIVLLKPLANARADGDNILAVIRGSAINNDGSDKASFTAPSVDGQVAVISEALAMSGVDADTISYVEAHGTGTMLGDPIEMNALKQAFGATTDRKQFCAVGSLKTNLGHLDVAAGVAGLMKTVLALQHREIPASLHCERPNPHIDFDNSPFFVNTALREWTTDGAPRRAGVSSFGIGGTNAHVVLEEAPAVQAAAPSRACQLLTLSARTPSALAASANRLADFLASHPDSNLADVAHTLQRGRHAFAFRRSIACGSVAAAIDALRVPAPHTKAGAAPEVVFMFPGGGTQYIGMGRELYASEALFRGVIDECAHILLPVLGLDLRTIMFPPEEQATQAAAALDQTHMALPALFALEYGIARQLEAWGVRASAMVGHSLGEYVAACLAGVFTLPDALRIVAERGRLISSLPTGNMLAVLQSAEQIAPRLGDNLWLACVNASGASTISGTPEATEKLAAQLEAEGIDFQLLQGWPGSHSGLMQPILEQFRATFNGVTLHAPARPYLSNLTGDWITAEQATDPAYWVAHLRNTVQFAGCVRTLLQHPGRVYVEVGPGHTLSNLLKREAAGSGQAVASVTTIPRRSLDGVTPPGNSLASVLQALGQAWEHGVTPDWDAFYGDEQRRRVALPTYPFERKRYWVEAPKTPSMAGAAMPQSWHDLPAAQEPQHDGTDHAPAFTQYGRPALPTAYAAAQTDTEKALCAIWENLLGIAPVGIDDDFFLLGGSSLIAIQLAARIRTTLRVELPLRTLFATPTVAAQAAAIASLAGATAAAPLPVLQPRAPGSVVPLSLAQQRLWFIDQLDHSASVAFHIPAALRLKGRLDTPALQATLDRIVARHESLRTRFGHAEGQTVQVIAPPDCGFALTVRDLSSLSGHEQQFAVTQISTDEGSAPFDLQTGPLIRGQLLRLGDEEHILLITQHHIISDGWSLGVLVGEVSALYAAFSQGQPDPLPPLALQYADYAAWQRTLLAGPAWQTQTDFWKAWLGDAPALLALPTDRPRPAQQSYAGSTVPVTFGPQLTQGLKALGQRHGATLFMTLLTGWAALLARISGQDDVVVGTPVANRQLAEVEPLIGFFVNTLALRVRPDGNATVAQLLAQVRADALRAYEHQDLSFDQVVEAVQPPRSMSHSPLFQVMLNLHNTPSYTELAMPGLVFEGIEQVQHTSQYDLMLSVTDAGHEISGEIRYASALFERGTVERLARYLEALLSAMAADDSQKLGHIALLDAQERQQVLAGFNDTAAPRKPDMLHQLFEAQAAAQPQATALVYGGGSVTYGELNTRTNRIAHHLIALGVRPEQRVALFAQRGFELVTGMLAVMKAGGVYMPLDPAYPAERLAFMLSDGAPVAVLAQQALADTLPLQAAPVVVIDGMDFAAQPEHNPAVAELDDDHAAYVIYTSGSTGKPKGVVNLHGGLSNLAQAQAAAFGVSAGSRVLQFASCSFDASISEVAMALCSGAALVLAEREALWPGEPLRHTLAQHAVTHATLPSSALAVYAGSDAFAPMTLIVAGEACPPELARRWAARHTLFNAYGPTETAVCASIFRCDSERDGVLPIGRPLANARIYVLDQFLQPVPPGAAGEICIGGAGVARGYLNRPELTAERFIADPFLTGERLYRTGDMGRWLDDGNLAFLGRNDFQVKLRGFRIEPGEIENQLLACDGVREAAVMMREDRPGDQRLVAYVAPHAGVQLQTAALREQLAARLAEYMVPSAFVVLDALPLTHNGKLNRAALPAPDIEAMGARVYAAPQGPTEQALARIWQELLGIEQAGRHDHFFELGGHSLLAVQLAARIQDALGVALPLSTVFQHPTLEALAGCVVDAGLGQYDAADIDRLEQELADELANLSDEEVERLLAQDGGL
ncbi:hypothetical protein GCM10027277_50700 [Pseudoduganella ginsengisoli]|uniref:Amino acid adenylation domain-containing protein n=1 Tax=Pseudoduganella ginsengisoli TaxID=1462440 RepID=A0A6L6Q7H7_9BURK|nr:non-ribosomal peptide synthetase/type I polyketide synthase [Pseudoduganella ginsengisoli]MTW05178.1 amino acid adenylation domain-containing protein [Pseudoduganella ginsengisoli]